MHDPVLGPDPGNACVRTWPARHRCGGPAQMWATSTDDRTTRDPGQPGVRLRMYADLRQALPAQHG
ncbi:DUF6207 family protein [Streptomyces sp. NPDC058676]|uniref:DUF6207 family protein n=1 Tax=Streptomyces sp. NPDC058676 TaxID=3346593 RepID=UPI00365712BB